MSTTNWKIFLLFRQKKGIVKEFLEGYQKKISFLLLPCFLLAKHHSPGEARNVTESGGRVAVETRILDYEGGVEQHRGSVRVGLQDARVSFFRLKRLKMS